MTTRQLATFHVADDLYGVDVGRVQEVLRHQPMTRVPLAPPSVTGLLNLRGQVVTAIDLRVRLALPQRPDGTPPVNVVVRSGEDVISLLVDAIGDVVEVTAGRFEDPPDTLSAPACELIDGAYQLEDRLLLALDVDEAVSVGPHR